MLVIGLTGGIGSGKSTVSALFAELGVPVLDTDAVAREVVAPGQPALAEIRDHFGTSIVQVDGSLDRRALRQRIFNDADARHRLEAITHPRIRAAVQAWLQAQTADYCIVVIPLLLEKGWTELIDRVLVVDVSHQQQIERTILRDQLTPAEVEAILHTQVDREQRLAAADDLIDNYTDIDHLRVQVQDLNNFYRALAGGLQ